jgi:hypothetical protein
MTQRHVRHVLGKDVHWQRVLVPAQDPPLAQPRDVRAHHVAVPRGQQRLPGLAPRPRRVEHLGVELPHPVDQRIRQRVRPRVWQRLLPRVRARILLRSRQRSRRHSRQTVRQRLRQRTRRCVRIALPGHGAPHARQIRRAQERHRRHVSRHPSMPVRERNDQAVHVQPPPALARHVSHRPDHVDPHGLQQRRRRVQPRCRVVVAADDHHVQRRQPPPRLGQELVPARLRLRWWIRRIEHVPRDHQRIHRLRDQRLHQPAQEPLVLVVARHVMQRMPQVPVRRMQETHSNPDLTTWVRRPDCRAPVWAARALADPVPGVRRPVPGSHQFPCRSRARYPSKYAYFQRMTQRKKSIYTSPVQLVWTPPRGTWYGCDS